MPLRKTTRRKNRVYCIAAERAENRALRELRDTKLAERLNVPVKWLDPGDDPPF